MMASRGVSTFDFKWEASHKLEILNNIKDCLKQHSFVNLLLMIVNPEIGLFN
jgi:hypothetical protein